MNFTAKIKTEIISFKLNDEELLSLIKGVIFSNLILATNLAKIRFNNLNLKNFFISILNKLKIKFQVEKQDILINFKEEIFINEKHANFLFAGIFLSSGSVSNLNSSSYHLEINFKEETICDYVMDFAKKHIFFNKILNKKNYVLYLKKNEAISDFLNIIGVKKSYFEFIDSVIERDLKNQVIRIFNLDVHNQEKMVDSHKNFLDNLEYVKKNKLEYLFSNDQLTFYEFKKQNEFMPLSEIAKEMSKTKKINKTKSGLNHWLIKLRNVCDDN